MPEPALIGHSASERGVTRMWQRRMEEHFCSPATYAHRNWCHSEDCPVGHPMKNFYTKRFNAAEGSTLLYGNPGAWQDLAQWALNRISWLEEIKQAEAERGSGSDFICGNALTVVDIQLYVNIFYWDTFCPGLKFFEKLTLPWMQAWYQRMHTRPAIMAARANGGYQDHVPNLEVKVDEDSV